MDERLRARVVPVFTADGLMVVAALAVSIMVAHGNAPLIMAPAAAVYAALLCMEWISLKRRSAGMDIVDLSGALSRIENGMAAGKRPLLDAIRDALPATAKGRGRETISRTLRRMEYGEEFKRAISAAADESGIGRGITQWLPSSEEGIGAVAARLRGWIATESERAAEGFQRNATIGIVVGTVAPSLLFFAFTGYSIVGYPGYLLYAFAFALTAVVPFAHSLIGMKIVDPYEE